MKYILLVSLLAFQSLRPTKAQVCNATDPTVPTNPCMNEIPVSRYTKDCCARAGRRATWSQYAFYKAGTEDKEQECKDREATALQQCGGAAPTFVCATNCSTEIKDAKKDCSQCTSSCDAEIADARREILQFSTRNGGVYFDRRVVKVSEFGDKNFPAWYQSEYDEYRGSGVYSRFWDDGRDDEPNFKSNRWSIGHAKGVVEWTQYYSPVRFFMRDSVPQKYGIENQKVVNLATYGGYIHPNWNGKYIYSQSGLWRLSSDQASTYTLLTFSIFFEIGYGWTKPGDHIQIDCNRPGHPVTFKLPDITYADFKYSRAVITFKDVNLAAARAKDDLDSFKNENFCTFSHRDGNGALNKSILRFGMLTVKV